ISAFRKRPPQVELDDRPSVRGLAEEVAGRRELRELLADLARLPNDQREALILAELHDNSHSDVAEILGCDREKVKSLVFQRRQRAGMLALAPTAALKLGAANAMAAAGVNTGAVTSLSGLSGAGAAASTAATGSVAGAGAGSAVTFAGKVVLPAALLKGAAT